MVKIHRAQRGALRGRMGLGLGLVGWGWGIKG